MLWHSQRNRSRCFFLEFSCFFNDLLNVGNLNSGSSAFSKSSLNIWKFSVHVLLKPGLENFEHYTASVCVCVHVLVVQSCPTLCDPVNCSLPSSSLHGIFQARILKWVVISFSRSSRTRPGLNPGLPHCRQTLYHLSHQGSAQNSPSQASTVHEPWTSRC